jgi:hypothetical protein
MFRKPFMVLGIVMLTATAPALAASLKKSLRRGALQKGERTREAPRFLVRDRDALCRSKGTIGEPIFRLRSPRKAGQYERLSA